MGVTWKDIPELTGHQDKESIGIYIARWKPLLGLHNWKIKVIWERPLRGKWNAEIYVSDKLKSAALELHRDYVLWSDYWAETTIIHELLHCSHKPIDMVWDKMVADNLHPEVMGTVEDCYTTEMERFIDNMSCRLYDIFHGLSE